MGGATLVKRSIQIHYTGDDWAGLYVDGKLEAVGHDYVVEEKAFGISGVELIQDDAFMRGGTDRKDAAPTLAFVEEYKQAREKRRIEADRLRTEAARLIEEAKKLDPDS